jgi:hypothetical protein
MKIGMLFAWSVPELRRMNGGQLLDAWATVTGHSRMRVHCYVILLMAGCSAIFNAVLWLGGSIFVDLFGLLLGLTLPSNIYFYNALNPHRAALRRYIEEHWNEFNQ